MRTLIIRQLGVCDYLPVLKKMQEFTVKREAGDKDEVWLLQHFPVFTQGQAGKPEHILDAGNIPIVQTDRGGQVTYHGPGQLVIYCLLDLQALDIGIRYLVNGLESTIISLLAAYNINAHRKNKAPGVYIKNQKIGSIGLRVRKGFSYHGLALNIDMDLSPFGRINPCGYPDLAVTQLKDWAAIASVKCINAIENEIIKHFCDEFGYNNTLINNIPDIGST